MGTGTVLGSQRRERLGEHHWGGREEGGNSRAYLSQEGPCPRKTLFMGLVARKLGVERPRVGTNVVAGFQALYDACVGTVATAGATFGGLSSVTEHLNHGVFVLPSCFLGRPGC